MNKRISTLFAASLLLSSVFGSVWAEDLQIGVKATKLESGQTYHLIMDKSGNQFAYGFSDYLEETETIIPTYANVASQTSTGVDPEVSYGSWGVCTDNSKTPRAKSFTLSLNVGF